ncbi:MAG: hypothetical protein J7641_22895 [Cyanobacteria bacterium SID2]|nr:hypothetical protein [Cyanobacteria bacterium SID2]MBP0003974.1 hypothetical protein [Cyanobacteria bacterium SBC]
MRRCQLWWETIVFSIQNNPPRFVESIVLVLAGIMLVLWVFDERWPYLVLSASYVLSSAASIWVRELIAPHRRDRKVRMFQATAMLGLTGFLMLLSLHEVGQ